MKRILDVLLVGIFMPMLVLLAACVALLILCSLGRPVLFFQQRPGLGGMPFTMVKFRTMNGARDDTGALLPDARRLTRVGKFLRSTSLDELPELWNVLKGDMSLVGPRPLLMEYLELYDSEQARRHDVRPGLTGLAQVNGRNSLSWEEKFRLDVWYVDNRSTLLDLKILIMTLWKVFYREGINSDGEATAARFTGERDS